MTSSPSDLQFDTAEGLVPGQVACAVCATPLTTEYHQLNGHAVCAGCRATADEERSSDRGISQFGIAAVYGLGAAIVGGVLYWGFVKVTNIELGLMAIAVGWLVGKGVMKGSNERGGRRYQVLAVALTYFSIAMSYGALMLGALGSPSSGVSGLGLGVLLLTALISPFLGGFSNIIGWVIIAIGLFEAWKHTREVPYASSGPFAISASTVARGSSDESRGDDAHSKPDILPA
jgi:hypothetical protein